MPSRISYVEALTPNVMVLEVGSMGSDCLVEVMRMGPPPGIIGRERVRNPSPLSACTKEKPCENRTRKKALTKNPAMLAP
jgi:hypothetical protein